jgi:hypothetical protein
VRKGINLRDAVLVVLDVLEERHELLLRWSKQLPDGFGRDYNDMVSRQSELLEAKFQVSEGPRGQVQE